MNFLKNIENLNFKIYILLYLKLENSKYKYKKLKFDI